MARRKRRKSNKGKIFIYYRYAFAALFVFVLGVLFVKLASSLVSDSKNSILGSETYYLDKGGDNDNSGSGKSGDDDHGGEDDSGSGSDSSGSGSSGYGGLSGSSNSSGGSPGSDSDAGSSGPSSSGGSDDSFQMANSVGGVSGGTQVDCVGPDGKTLKTSFSSCEDLNEAWGNANFQFKVTSGGTSNTTTRVFDLEDIKDEAEDENEDKNEIDEAEVENDDETEIEDEDESGARTRTKSEKTEIKISEPEMIRARTKDGRIRIDIASGGIKTRIENRDDRVVVKAETEDGAEEELEDDTILKIDDRLNASGIKVATAGAEGFIIQRGNAGAVTEFPITIDLATNTLSINSPDGVKEVSVLPDQAIDNLLAANVINNLVKTQALNANEIESVEQVITLGASQGELVYQVQGISNQKLLGLIPVVIERTVTVSAESGEVEDTDEPLLDRILDIISL